MELADFAEVLEAAAAKARELDSSRRAERRDWVDQGRSALGRKRHCAAVRRLPASGDPGAAVIGRRHLLSADAYEGELRLVYTKTKKASRLSVADELRAELGLRGGR